MHASLIDGKFLDTASAQFPTVVLGSTAAQKLGIVHVGDGLRVYIANKWFDVIGIIGPVAAAPGRPDQEWHSATRSGTARG